MRRGFLLMVCATGMALAVAPAAASACASLANVKSLHGKVALDFHATNSGPDTGNGGTYSATLKRDVNDVSVNLTHKLTVHNGPFGPGGAFTGKAAGGSASIDDTYDDSGAHASGKETYAGPLTNQLPNYGTAALYWHRDSCRYDLTVSFSVVTEMTGTFDSGEHPAVTGTGYGGVKHIPNNLHFGGNATLPGGNGDSCLGNPLKTGQPCYRFGDGLIGLCNTSEVGTNNCPADNKQPVGSAGFSWDLTPTFKTIKKKK